MRHIWSVVCKDALIDKDSNAVSLFKCLEGFSAKFAGPQLPSDIPVACKFVTLWSRSDMSTPEKGSARIRYRMPQGKEVEFVQYEVDLTVQSRHRTVLDVQGLPYQGNGVYEFILETQGEDSWRPVTDVPLQVTVEHAPASGKQ